MGNFKNLLSGGLSGVLMLVLMFVTAALTIMPLQAIGLPIWLCVIIAIVLFMFAENPVVAIGQIVLWIVGLVFVIINPQTVFSIVYYIGMVVFLAPIVINLVKLIRR